jgi:hypothetical protein
LTFANPAFECTYTKAGFKLSSDVIVKILEIANQQVAQKHDWPEPMVWSQALMIRMGYSHSFFLDV